MLKLPDAWEKSFDVVHQRLLISALRSSEWPTAIRELFRVLKPGGWVQLGELGDWPVPSPENAIAKHKHAHMEFYKLRGFDLGIAKKLPELLRVTGFVNVTSEVLRIPLGKKWGRVGVDGAHNQADVFRSLKGQIVSAGGFGVVKSEEDYDELMDGVEREWDEIEGYAIEFHIIYAQRL